MNDKDRQGRDYFFKMFRKKKKTKEYLLTCMKQLSLTTEEQTTIIRALTEQSNHHQKEIKQLQDKIISMTTDVQKLNDNNVALADALSTTEAQLLIAEKESETGREREKVLDENNGQLSAALKEADKGVNDLDKQVAVYKERFKFTEENNETLSKAVAEYKDTLDITKSENDRLKLRLRSLEKDTQHFKELAEYEKKTRISSERRYDELRKTWDNLRLYEYSVQLDLDAENECLKYDVKSLTKKVKKMKEALNSIQRDKMLILSYYARQREGGYLPKHAFHFNTCDKTMKRLTLETTDGSFMPNNPGTSDEIHPDLLENITLKNKLLSLECRIYRKEQLVDELVTIIQEHDPDFKIEDQECLRIYLDATHTNKDSSEVTADTNGHKEAQTDTNGQGVYSSTISSDSMDDYLC